MRQSMVRFLTLLLVSGCVVAAGCDKQDDVGSNAIKAGKWTILDTRTDDGDAARALQNAEDTLTKYGDLGGMVGLWSYNTPQIIEACKNAKRLGEVKIVAFDEDAATLQGVRDGHVHATVVQQPYQFGYKSVEVLTALANGKKDVVPEDGQIVVPIQVVRKEGVDAFEEELKKQIAAGKAAKKADAGSPEGKTHIAFVTNNPSDFWEIARAGVNQAATDLGNVYCEFHTPTDGVAGQQRIIENLITNNVQGMAISPNDADTQTDMINKAAAKMTVICHDSDAPKSDRVAYVGTNNYLAGREAGKLIREALPDGGTLMLFVGKMDAQNARERRQGIIDELSGKPLPE